LAQLLDIGRRLPGDPDSLPRTEAKYRSGNARRAATNPTKITVTKAAPTIQPAGVDAGDRLCFSMTFLQHCEEDVQFPKPAFPPSEQPLCFLLGSF
jgi:hypothetical protein